MRRKALFAILMTLFGLYGCSSSDDEPARYDYIWSVGSWSVSASEYGIDPQKTEIDGVVEGVDTAFIYFYGRNKGKLWIWGYEKSTKVKTYDFLSDFNLPDKITVDLGYGETETHKITDYTISVIDIHKNNCAFLMSYGFENEYYNRRLQLFLTNGSTTIKSIEVRAASIQHWYDGSILLHYAIVDKMTASIERYCTCYSTNGEELYSFEENLYDKLSSASKFDCLNINECVAVTIRDKSITIEKIDLKSGIKWSINADHFSTLNEPYRMDNYFVTKSGNIWNYTFNYTLYSGKKGTYNIGINIETGEVLHRL